MHFPFIDLGSQYQAYKVEIQAAMNSVLDSHTYIQGPAVTELEQQLTNFIGCRATLGCSNGTDALLLALLAAGVGPGDEVITPSFTFVATAEVIALLGAKPVFADVDLDTALVTAESIEPCITKATKVIIPVSLFGQCPEMGPIIDMAAEYQILLIEDAAQSFGAVQVNRYSGTMTPLACTSFFPAKPLGCYGDGGAIFINDESYLERLIQLRNHGQSSQYTYACIGINGRLDSLQAAILQVKLAHFQEECTKRQQIATRYDQHLHPFCEQLCPLSILASNMSVYAQYTVSTNARDALRDYLTQQGIPTAIYYPKPLHMQQVYRERSEYRSLPNTERLAKTVLSLPMSPFLQESHQNQVIDAIGNFYNQRTKQW